MINVNNIFVVVVIMSITTGIVLAAKQQDVIVEKKCGNRTLKSNERCNKIPLYLHYHMGKDAVSPFDKNNNHQWADAAIINAKWYLIHKNFDNFDWTTIDRKIADWTGSVCSNVATNKKVIIRIVPYGAGPLGVDYPLCPSCNDDTPPWIYNAGVPKITFVGGGEADGEKLTVPQVWHPNFYPIYDKFLEAVGKKYNNDERVAAVNIGFGHLGTWNAQSSKGGSAAFIAQPYNWTISQWEEHIKKVINHSSVYIKKPLIMMASPRFGRNIDINKFERENFEAAKRILEYGTQLHVSVLFAGLDPIRTTSREFIAPMVQYLSKTMIPSDVRIGFTDDWPLWDSSPSDHTQGRNTEGFEEELTFVIRLWNSINRSIPIFFAFHEPEACATNQNLISKYYRRCVDYQNNKAAKNIRVIAEKYLFFISKNFDREILQKIKAI